MSQDRIRTFFTMVTARREEEAADVLSALDDELLISAFIEISEGSTHVANRSAALAKADFSAAGEHFEKAADEYPAFERPLQVWAAHTRALAEFCAGLEKQQSFDFAGAAMSIQVAANDLRQLLDKTLPGLIDVEDDEDAKALLLRLGRDIRDTLPGVETTESEAIYQGAMAKADWADAAAQAKRMVETMTASLESLSVENDTYRPLFEVQLEKVHADAEVAAAWQHRDSQEWNEAKSALGRARDHLRHGAAMALKTDLPTAQALQQTLVSYAAYVVEQATREFDREKLLREQLAEVRQQLEALRSAGTAARVSGDVNVNVQQTTTQEQRQHQEQEQRLVLTQHIGRSVQEELRQLIQALPQSELVGRDALQQEASSLVSEPDPGDVGFLDRAAKFTGKLSTIVENAEAAAGPIVPIVKTLLKLLPVALIVL